MLTPEAITLYLQQVARFATVEVAGQTKVAGRDAYLLRMTPVATDTALGYVQAAIDGKTMLPLQLEVYAKGGTAPVLRFGFNTVSYDSIDPATFAFTPPAGAKVTTKTDRRRGPQGQGRGDAAVARRRRASRRRRRRKRRSRRSRALCSRAARSPSWSPTSSPGRVTTPRGRSSGAPCSVRPARSPAPARRSCKALGAATGMDLPAPAWTRHSPASPSVAGATTASPSSVLLYGQGFGTIALAQTQTTPDLAKQLKQLQQTSQILGTTTVGNGEGAEVGTPLGGIVVWQQGGTTLVAGGMVPMSDLEAFASSVR